ncbi:hypothetical protein IC006_0532 [Sulfuracidifex tepidarius]|uniref:Uncharacterized protein n=1 Tax=Sulfuracidifex tepidarius TaxID=1294262 RepID=A0A510E1N0_9CREN|nr:hypothetical protein IC006_0532 [Sulfuracidifex tepidarius]BBG25998.1 hypothetical protein IC007_0503 [Sulfuracidifex tepidarius]
MVISTREQPDPSTSITTSTSSRISLSKTILLRNPSSYI